MKLHGAIISPNVRKVVLACMIKGIKYESNIIIPGPALKTPEFLKINPLGQIPALEDQAQTINDSNVILNYLEEKYPENSLLPTSPEARAQTRWLAEYAGAALFPCCLSIFTECFINPNYFKQAINQEAVDKTLTQKLPPVLNYLETQVPEKGFLLGDKLGMADISIISMFINAQYGDYRVDENQWPKLAAYVTRGFSHPVVAKCIEDEKDMIKMITG